MGQPWLILSCEHGGNRVPAAYRRLFDSPAARRALASHRGQDLGALAVAKRLGARLGEPVHAVTVTRLLVDLNRSLGHRRLFSEFSRCLDSGARQALLERVYRSHRDRVEAAVAAALRDNEQVCHVAVHSFAARLDGRTRRADIGLLYDPRRAPEAEFCARWHTALRARTPDLKVRRNYPYRGVSDGFSTYLRRQFAADRYIGIELELNQARLASARERVRIADAVAASLSAALGRDRPAAAQRP